MMFLLNLGILIIGFVILVKGADLFVDGSSNLAKNFRVPSLIIGLTIVALGTSAPELAVSTSAALQGSNEIALSNVVGSNIFNLLCVLGICAIYHPVPVEKGVLKRDFPVSIVTTLLVLVLTCASTIFSGRWRLLEMEDEAGTINRKIGMILVILFVGYIVYLIMDAKHHPEQENELEKQPVWKCVLLIVIGLILIVSGGQTVVYSAKAIARTLGMTETLIGLTIVAVGTSLPELVTSIVAARKGENSLAVGNAIGSNIFNLLLILGVSSMIQPVSVNLASVYDMGILIIVSIVAYLFSLTSNKINRFEGIAMILIYVADVFFAIIR